MHGICLKNSLCSEQQLDIMRKLVHDVKDIEGSFVECGVWKGGMAMWMAHCQKKQSLNRDIYLYDTFDGMTEPDDMDGGRAPKIFNGIKNGNIKRDYDDWHNENKWAYAPLDLVKNNMKRVDYNKGEIHYVVGDVCETLNKVVPEQIAIIHLDTDWYKSTKKELDVLFPKLVKDGFLFIDDYNSWEGSTKAVDEFLIDKDNVKKHYYTSGLVLQKISI